MTWYENNSIERNYLRNWTRLNEMVITLQTLKLSENQMDVLRLLGLNEAVMGKIRDGFTPKVNYSY